jgi:hypothetical protein
MTSVPHQSSTDEHPEVGEISALTEGLLPQAEAADVRAHVSDCALCQDIEESLTGIRGLLGTLPGPGSMPADVASRIDAALAAEALADAAADAVSRETRSDAPATGHARHSGGAVSRETTRPPGHASGATGPTGQRRTRRWSKIVLTTTAAAAVLGVGAFLGQLAVNGGGSSSEDTAKQQNADGGKTKSTGGSSTMLGERVRKLLSPPNGAQSDTGGSPSGNSPKLKTPMEEKSTATVPRCVRSAMDRTDVPLAVSHDSWRGQPAYIVVLPHTGDQNLVDAYVVTTSCVSDPGTPSELLQRQSYPRP